jgi:superfamily II DNA/RNA helicase
MLRNSLRMLDSIEHSSATFQTLATAREALEQYVESFFQRGLYYLDHHSSHLLDLMELPEAAWTPEGLVITAPTGTGKTCVVVQKAADCIKQAKLDGRRLRVLVLVPHHQLSEEIANQVRQCGKRLTGTTGVAH